MERRYRRDSLKNTKKLRLSTPRFNRKKKAILRRTSTRVQRRQVAECVTASNSPVAAGKYVSDTHLLQGKVPQDLTLLEHEIIYENSNEKESDGYEKFEHEFLPINDKNQELHNNEIFEHVIISKIHKNQESNLSKIFEHEIFSDNSPKKILNHSEIPEDKITANDNDEEVFHTCEKICETMKSGENNIMKDYFQNADKKNEDCDFELGTVEDKDEDSLNNAIDPVDPSERCIINPSYFIPELQRVFGKEWHRLETCTSDNIQFRGMKNSGLSQKFLFLCNSCGEEYNILSESDNEQFMDINTCAVAGTMSSGTDFIELEEILGFMGISCMSEKLFYPIKSFLQCAYEGMANQEMKIAGAEEREIAEKNDIREGGYPSCVIKFDGTWCTRSYGAQGRSKSGAAVIVGKNTNKILFYGVRNTYCQICHEAENRNATPKPHVCYRNWDQSASAMESDIAVEGFRKSIEQHGLVYSKIIGDNDSSVYLRLLESNPYEDVFIEKLDCVTHLLCNMGKQLKKVAQLKIGKQGKECKEALLKNICRIRYDIQEAAKFRASEENISTEDKISRLQNDIRNVPYHVFGDHRNCATYFCDGKPKKDEENIVSEMNELGLFDEIVNVLDDISYQAESILNYENTNMVESINSSICKRIGGKRKNKIQRGAYNSALAVTTVHINTRKAGSKLNEFLHCDPPTALIALEDRRIEKHEKHLQKLAVNPAKRKYEVVCSEDEEDTGDKKLKEKALVKKRNNSKKGNKDYGKNCQKLDISEEQFENRVIKYYQKLKIKQETRDVLEYCTRVSYTTNKKTFMVERNILMDKFFGEICRMRASNPGNLMVQRILFPSIRRTVQDKYEEKEKKSALKALMEEKMVVNECGLFIHKQMPYLGSRPDATTSTEKENDTIIMIECPHKAKNFLPHEAIAKKIGKLDTIFDKNGEELNEKNHIFYKLIGAMEITGKNYSLFILKTKKGMKSVRVQRNRIFWEVNMRDRLKFFYEQKLLPEIIDSRSKRNMPIREKMDAEVLDYNIFCKNINKGLYKYTTDETDSDEEEENNNNKDIDENEIEDDNVDMHDGKFGENNNEENDRNVNENNNQDDNTNTYNNEINENCDDRDNNDQNKADNQNELEDDKRDVSKTKYNDEILFSVRDLSQQMIDILQSEAWFNTDIMDYFGRIIKENSNGFYEPEYTAKAQILSRIQAACPLKKNIQILHIESRRHWICSFYDTENIYIYDSLNINRLNREARLFLEHLHPYYDFNKRPVIFPKVQQQNDGRSCGEFSIAFATSLLYGLNPQDMIYHHSAMRNHILKILRNRTIEHFPLLKTRKHTVIPSLSQAIRDGQETSKVAHEFNLIGKKCLCEERRGRHCKLPDIPSDQLETIEILDD